MHDRMLADLFELRKANQYRALTNAAGIQLNSNDYLGLSVHPGLKEAVVSALGEDDRFASTGSRLLSGNHPRWERVEEEFAEFVGVDAALYFSSGYMANVGLLSSILESGDTVFSDAANHSSTIDGIRLSRARKVIFPHLDLTYLEDELRNAAGPGQRVIVVESIFSMDGDRAPLRDLLHLCDRYDAWLVVDEAHAIGVEGPSGRGLASTIDRKDRILATIHTCGKALASMGAFVAGSGTLRDFLVNHARTFIFTTALPPYCAAHVRAAIRLVSAATTERSHLIRLSQYAREQLRSAQIDIGRSDSQIIPIMLGSNESALRVAAVLTAAGFAVRAIRPPTVPRGTARLRLS